MSHSQSYHGIAHPHMNHLANTYYSVGKYADAEKVEIKVLDMRNRLLGEEHPDTISAVNNLATTYQTLDINQFSNI